MNAKEKIILLLSGKLVKGSSIFLLMKLLSMIIGYFNIWIVSKYFSASALGIFSFVLSLSTLVVVLSKGGASMVMVKYASKFLIKNRLDKLKHFYIQIFKTTLISTLIFSLILFIFNDYIAKYLFDKPQYSDFIKISALIILPVSFTQINSQLLRAFKKMGQYSFFQFYSTFITVIILIFFMIFSKIRENEIPTIIHVYSIILMSVLSFISIFRLANWKKIKITERISIKEISKVSFPMWNIALAAAVLNWADKIILGIYVSEAEIGIYHAMFRTSVFITIFLVAANSVLTPRFSELWEMNKMNEIKSLIYRSTKLLTIITFPLFVLIIFFSKNISMLFGNEFISGYPILIILSIGQFFSVWAGPVGTFLLMSGNQNFNRNISVITTILFLVSCPILTKFFGIMGASISISFIYIARNFIYVFYIYKKYNITFLYVPFFTKNNK